MTETKTFDIDFSFKKNNVDELFFNLSENPIRSSVAISKISVIL